MPTRAKERDSTLASGRRTGTRQPSNLDRDALWAGLQGGDLAQRLVHAAVEVFAEKGYYAATTRDITTRAGLSSASLYVAFESKDHLLYVISKTAHEGIYRALTEVDCDLPHVQRVRELVRCLVEWHFDNKRVAAIAQSELRALRKDDYRKIASIRDAIEEILRQAIVAGVNDRTFMPAVDSSAVVRAIVSIAVDVTRWYNVPSTPLAVDLASSYAQLAVNMLNADISE